MSGKDGRIFNAMLHVVSKMQWQPIGKWYDTGDRQLCCPFCFNPKSYGHIPQCELYELIHSLEIRVGKYGS